MQAQRSRGIAAGSSMYDSSLSSSSITISPTILAWPRVIDLHSEERQRDHERDTGSSWPLLLGQNWHMRIMRTGWEKGSLANQASTSRWRVIFARIRHNL